MVAKKVPQFHTHAIYVGGDPRNIDLIIGKVYRVLRPKKGDMPYDCRVIDESAEDYIYPADWFVPIDVPGRVKRALLAAK